MKTLLIPTDFRMQSLNCVPKLAQLFFPSKLNIIWVHLLGITDSPNELQLLARRSAEYKHIPDEFYNTCTRLKRDYPNKINNIRIEFFYGNTMASFKNYIEANEVDLIIELKDYSYKMLTEKSVDPASLTYRCGIPTMPISVIHSAPVEKPQVAQQLIEETV